MQLTDTTLVEGVPKNVTFESAVHGVFKWDSHQFKKIKWSRKYGWRLIRYVCLLFTKANPNY